MTRAAEEPASCCGWRVGRQVEYIIVILSICRLRPSHAPAATERPELLAARLCMLSGICLRSVDCTLLLLLPPCRAVPLCAPVWHAAVQARYGAASSQL